MENLKKIAFQEARIEAASSLKMFVFFLLTTVVIYVAINAWLSMIPLMISLASLKTYLYMRHIGKKLLEVENNEPDDDLEDTPGDLVSVVVDFADAAPKMRITCDATIPACTKFLSVVREKIESDKAGFLAEFNILKENFSQTDSLWTESIRALQIEELHIPPPGGSLLSAKKHLYADVVFAGEAKHYWMARYGVNGFSCFGDLG